MFRRSLNDFDQSPTLKFTLTTLKFIETLIFHSVTLCLSDFFPKLKGQNFFIIDVIFVALELFFVVLYFQSLSEIQP